MSGFLQVWVWRKFFRIGFRPQHQKCGRSVVAVWRFCVFVHVYAFVVVYVHVVYRVGEKSDTIFGILPANVKIIQAVLFY